MTRPRGGFVVSGVLNLSPAATPAMMLWAAIIADPLQPLNSLPTGRPAFANLLILKRPCWLSTQASKPRQENEAQAKDFQQHQHPTEGQLYTVRKGTWCNQLAGAFICCFA